ncbi:hypothetical protein K490DRAFT_46125 [Saccharata proteae CBS 121410]|uniref:Xylanolytic transcriptional activator regulatory domain-containing protein n=1 Tax=Saccharata proteae CBS 121410 TaxID=1314787 RepID=A0A9P4LTJ0_9PEZI|nr:hypothetical protein K490DRAFT_46125 [Saccharata proteae CBS 121410]
MWKDAEGNIVTKRPNLANRRPSSVLSQDQYSSGSSGSSRRGSGDIHGDAPISPPISSIHSANSDGNGRRSSDVTTSSDPSLEAWAFPPLELSPGPEPEAYVPLEPLQEASDKFWSAAHGLPAANLRTNNDDVPYDDVFNPDTAASFNMPFTTMNNYSWLFDLDLGTNQQYPASADILSGTFSAAHVDQDPLPRTSTHTFRTGVLSEHTPTYSNHPSLATPNTVSISSSHGFSELETAHSLQLLGNPLPPTSFERTQVLRDDPAVHDDIYPASDIARHLVPAHASHFGIEFERPMSTIDQSSRLPAIDEFARAQILDLIDAARPVTPDGFYIPRNHSRLSLSSLQTYCDLYFTRFNTAYPLLHQPTFDPSRVEPLLLLSVLLIGATYCEKDAHQLAVCIHDVVRPQVFAHAGFNAKPDLWVLQTILLVECFGKSRAGQKQHDMAHLFHGLLINLIRRSDCQIVRSSMSNEWSNDLESDWRAWAEAEQKKRLAYLCFMWDVQHAVLFCQSLCMSAFELRSALPCDQALWEADSARRWQQLRKRRKTPPLFLNLLKAYLNPSTPPAPKSLNALSRVLLLHGLMSVSWDMKRRDQTSLGLVGNSAVMGDWKVRIGKSYDAWKTDFDAYSSNYLDLYGQNDSLLRREMLTFTTAHNAIYHAAHILLNAEFLDLQIYAGARHILGRPVGRPDYERSQRIIKSWASQQPAPASTAAWHAAQLLRAGMTDLQDFDSMGLFHYPWTVYLATLTCWAFHHARPAAAAATTTNSSAPSASNSSAEAADHHFPATAPHDSDIEASDPANSSPSPPASPSATDPTLAAKAEMRALIDAMAARPLVRGAEDLQRFVVGGKWLRSSGLVALVAKCLKGVRWQVVHDAMMVLRGLVPWRFMGVVEGRG